MRGEKGNALIEMTLVGIPVIFVVLSVFEISRAMWTYNTMAHAVKEGVRFASVHGESCVPNPPSITNSCAKTVGDVASRIRYTGIGIDATITTVEFSIENASNVQLGSFSCTLSDCVNNASLWPPAGANGVGRRIQVKISAPFRTALGMLWPGHHPVAFAPFHLGAAASEQIHF